MENFRQATIDLDFNRDIGLKKESLKKLDKYLKGLNNVFKKENQNFAELCFYVYQVKALFGGYAKSVYNKKGQFLTFNSIMQQFGLNDTEISRLCSCYDKFMETTLSEDRLTITSYKIMDIFFPFS